MNGTEARDYLQRSAKILRSSVRFGVSDGVNYIDKELRLVFSKDGPSYKSVAEILSGRCCYRRVRNLYYTHDFAEMFKAEVLVYFARVRSFLPRLAMRALDAGNSLASLYPSKVACWWPVIEDIFTSPIVSELKEKLKADLIQHNEYQSLSVDATLRCTLSVMGQPHPKHPSEPSVYPKQDRLTRVLTVRGRTSAVIAMEPMSAENSKTYAQVLSDSIPTGAHGQVRFLSTDNPSNVLWQALKSTLPNLEVISLDTVHLAIVYEYGSWNRRTESSSLLRTIMGKFCAYDGSVQAAVWGSPFTGAEHRPLTRDEEISRDHILKGSMSAHRARRIISSIDGNKPFLTRVEFIESLAAIVVLYPEEVKKVAKGANRPLYKILYTAAAWDRIEWYLNNTRQRHSMTPSMLSLLPDGSASNEALHAEINNWFRQTQFMHQALHVSSGLVMLAGRGFRVKCRCARCTISQLLSLQQVAGFTLCQPLSRPFVPSIDRRHSS